MVGRLHVITDTRAGRAPITDVEAVLDAGAPVVQLRAKGLPVGDLYALASVVGRACAEHKALLIVNDHVDIALAVGAGGVHLGAGDLPVPVARRLLGTSVELGATARDPESARRRQAEGATYLGVGPAFASTSKDGLPAPLGIEGVGRVADAVSIPVIAVGGVTADRVPELLAAGAHGVAVIAAVSEAPDPGVATKELLAALEATR